MIRPTDHRTGPAVGGTSTQYHISPPLLQAAACAFREKVIEQLGERPIQEAHDLKNWVSQNTAGFVCKDALLGLKRLMGGRGERRARKSGGGGIAAERAGTCPVLRVCHPQLEHRAEQRKHMNKRDEVVLIVC